MKTETILAREQLNRAYGDLKMYKAHNNAQGIRTTKERIRQLEAELAEHRRARKVAMGVAV